MSVNTFVPIVLSKNEFSSGEENVVFCQICIIYEHIFFFRWKKKKIKPIHKWFLVAKTVFFKNIFMILKYVDKQWHYLYAKSMDYDDDP